MATNNKIIKKNERICKLWFGSLHRQYHKILSNEARSEGYKEGQQAERQRCIGILKPLEKALSELKEAQKEWEFNPKYDTENALRNCAIIDVINQSKAVAKLSEKVD